MDILSELFNDLVVASTVYGRVEARAPWGVGYPEAPIAGFHVILEGECWLHRRGTLPPLRLVAGDFVVLLHGTPHELRDDAQRLPFCAPSVLTVLGLGAPAAPTVASFKTTGIGTRLAVHHAATIGGQGVRMSYLCGAFTFTGDAARPLLSALPDVIHVPGEKGRMMPWVESHLKAVACELTAGRPGSAMVVTRLSEVLFVQAVRSHLSDLPTGAVGWPAASRDAYVCQALALIHRTPERDWTIASLGAAVGLSRSSFAARFLAVMDQAPLTYLTGWRMHRARGLLRDPAMSIAQIAERVGYGSAAAFTSAFKRETGEPPGAWRRTAA